MERKRSLAWGRKVVRRGKVGSSRGVMWIEALTGRGKAAKGKQGWLCKNCNTNGIIGRDWKG